MQGSLLDGKSMPGSSTFESLLGENCKRRRTVCTGLHFPKLPQLWYSARSMMFVMWSPLGYSKVQVSVSAMLSDCHQQESLAHTVFCLCCATGKILCWSFGMRTEPRLTQSWSSSDCFPWLVLRPSSRICSGWGSWGVV